MCLNTNDPSDEASPAATRQVLLEAAVVVFAERGFRAASVREICQRAAVNVAAVNYHFGDKESLYAEALTFALHCAHAKYPADLGLAPGATPAERLYAFVHSFLLRIFDEGRAAWHGKMMSREMIEPTAALDGLVQAEIRPMSEQLSRIIRDLLGRVFTAAGIPHAFAGPPAMFGVHFTPEAPANYRDWRVTNSSLYRAFAWNLIERGVMLEPDSREPWFICEAHQHVDLGWLEDIATQSIKSACAAGG